MMMLKSSSLFFFLNTLLSDRYNDIEYRRSNKKQNYIIKIILYTIVVSNITNCSEDENCNPIKFSFLPNFFEHRLNSFGCE